MVKRLILDQILKFAPQIDHARIVHLDSCYEFPFDFTRADEFALYRTYAVPSIAKLLDSTGEFTGRTQRRYDDSKLIISELVEHGYESERGQRAMRQMNHHHGRFNISPPPMDRSGTVQSDRRTGMNQGGGSWSA